MNANSDLLKREMKEEKQAGPGIEEKCVCRFSWVYVPIQTIQNMSNIICHSISN